MSPPVVESADVGPVVPPFDVGAVVGSADDGCAGLDVVDGSTGAVEPSLLVDGSIGGSLEVVLDVGAGDDVLLGGSSDDVGGCVDDASPPPDVGPWPPSEEPGGTSPPDDPVGSPAPGVEGSTGSSVGAGIRDEEDMSAAGRQAGRGDGQEGSSGERERVNESEREAEMATTICELRVWDVG